MAKYRLVQDNVPINFNIAPDFKDLKSDNLKDIIKFTGFFKTSEELKEYLKKYKLIKTNNTFKISYKYNHKDKNLMYGVSYKDDIKFLDPINISRFLEQNKNNYDLLDNLCKHYKNSYLNNGNIFRIRNYLMKLDKIQVALDDESEIVQDYLFAMKDFVHNECYRFNKKDGTYKLNFKGMRDLGMFLANQLKKNPNLTTNNMDNINDIIKYIEGKQLIVDDTQTIETEPQKTKTKKRKKEFPGQMTFIITDGNVEI